MGVEVEKNENGLMGILQKQVLPNICGLASLVVTELMATERISIGDNYLVTLPNGVSVGDVEKMLDYFVEELLPKLVSEILIEHKTVNIINLIDLIWIELKKVKVEKLSVH